MECKKNKNFEKLINILSIYCQIDHKESKNHGLETQKIVFKAPLGSRIKKLVRYVKSKN